MAVKRNRILTTKQGHVGTGAHPLRQDEEFVLEGSQAPVILRRSGGMNEQQALSQDAMDRCSLIGVCYVDGRKDGRAVDSAVDWETLISTSNLRNNRIRAGRRVNLIGCRTVEVFGLKDGRMMISRTYGNVRDRIS